ncbi:PCI domain-containing protein [Seiridium cupressi]
MMGGIPISKACANFKATNVIFSLVEYADQVLVMEQSKALNALEPFLALTKSATSPRAAADLVTRATSTPGTYVFAELLETPQIQALAQSQEHVGFLTQLQIFSYGTYADYTSTGNLPPLNEQQMLKLRQLSLLTLAKNPQNLSYASLQTSLALSDARAVEELVISATYADLIQAQLDPRNQAVLVSSVSPLRDLAPGSIPSMLANLQEWSSRCTSTLADLEAQIKAIRDTAAARHSEKKQWQEKTDSLVAAQAVDSDNKAKDGVHTRNQSNLISRATAALRSGRGKRDRPGGSAGPAVDAEDDEMDVDDDEDTDDGPVDGIGGAAGKKRASRRRL